VPEVPQRVRILCVDERGAVLLLNWRDPVDGHVFWEPPGGGIEAGETAREAAVRELREETGLALGLRPRSVLVPRAYRWMGKDFRHVEELFLADAGSGVAPDPDQASPTEEEVASFLGWRYVAPGEMGSLDAPLEPPALAEALERLTSLP
jgi:8-oxo-dGTP diphosphatase